jgi:hypothetical protein
MNYSHIYLSPCLFPSAVDGSFTIWERRLGNGRRGLLCSLHELVGIVVWYRGARLQQRSEEEDKEMRWSLSLYTTPELFGLSGRSMTE